MKPIQKRALKLLNNLTLSPSSIKSFENCRAGYLFSKVIFPYMETKKTRETTSLGKAFHQLAEHNFNKDALDTILVYEKERVKEELHELQLVLEKRDYYSLPAMKEELLQYPIQGLGTLIGIPDRFVRYPNGRFLVVDYKTSFFTNTDTDKRQVLTYAYLLWRVLGIDPQDMEILIDYVRADELFRYTITVMDLELHENYLKSRFRLIRTLLEEFIRKPVVTKIAHSPGDCALCPMVGACCAYQAWIEPRFDPTEPGVLSTEALIREKGAREELKKVHEERLSLINRTLLFRLEHSRPEPNDPKNRSYKEIIEGSLCAVQQHREDYDAKAVINEIIRKRMEQINTERMPLSLARKIITDIILEHIPERMQARAVVPEIREVLEQWKERRSNAPYLRFKS